MVYFTKVRNEQELERLMEDVRNSTYNNFKYKAEHYFNQFKGDLGFCVDEADNQLWFGPCEWFDIEGCTPLTYDCFTDHFKIVRGD